MAAQALLTQLSAQIERQGADLAATHQRTLSLQVCTCLSTRNPPIFVPAGRRAVAPLRKTLRSDRQVYRWSFALYPRSQVVAGCWPGKQWDGHFVHISKDKEDRPPHLVSQSAIRCQGQT